MDDDDDDDDDDDEEEEEEKIQDYQLEIFNKRYGGNRKTKHVKNKNNKIT